MVLSIFSILILPHRKLLPGPLLLRNRGTTFQDENYFELLVLVECFPS